MTLGASPDDWAASLARPPLVDLSVGRGSEGRLRRWRDTGPDVVQPALDAHYVVLHMGGPKRIQRTGEGARRSAEADVGALTLVPAGAAYAWNTQGAVDYAHFYISPARLRRGVETIFDREGRGVTLAETLARRDDLLAGLFQAMLAEAGSAAGDPLYLETLAEAFLGRLLREHSNLETVGARAPYALAPRRLIEVVEFIEANLASELRLEALASVARLSRYHFSRAFARATGLTPHAFVIARRIEAAKILLRTTDLPVEAIALRCGFRGGPHFSTCFRKATARRPSDYRRDW